LPGAYDSSSVDYDWNSHTTQDEHDTTSILTAEYQLDGGASTAVRAGTPR